MLHCVQQLVANFVHLMFCAWGVVYCDTIRAEKQLSDAAVNDASEGH